MRQHIVLLAEAQSLYNFGTELAKNKSQISLVTSVKVSSTVIL